MLGRPFLLKPIHLDLCLRSCVVVLRELLLIILGPWFDTRVSVRIPSQVVLVRLRMLVLALTFGSQDLVLILSSVGVHIGEPCVAWVLALEAVVERGVVAVVYFDWTSTVERIVVA